MSDFCQTCADTRVVISAGSRTAVAAFCPDCFATCPSARPDAVEERVRSLIDALETGATPLTKGDVVCDDGWVILDRDDGAPISQPCPACASVRNGIKLFNQALIPSEYANAEIEGAGPGACTATSATNRAALQTLTKRALGFSEGARGIILTGGVGTGKTHWMCAAIRHLTLQEHVSCRFIEFSQLLDALRASYDDGSDLRESDLYGELQAVEVLVIDELGKQVGTQWQLQQLDRIISDRYNDRGHRATYATTNFPTALPADAPTRGKEGFERTTLEERVGKRIYDRLCQMCDFRRLTGESRRRAG